MRQLDLKNWKRREHFEFFREYHHPFFNICANVDVTALSKLSAAPGGPSFFLASLFLSLRAANEIEEFRYRIRANSVVVHDIIHGGATILQDDETFCFAYFDYSPDFTTFARRGNAALEKIKRRSRGLRAGDERDDLIHYSVIPWISFTSFAHARRFGAEDSVPKIVFGKFERQTAGAKMPVSVEVHHSLMDGLHVGKFLESFQENLRDLRGLEGGEGRK